MPELSALTKLRTIPIKLDGGEVLNVTYDPGSYNQEWQEALEDIQARRKDEDADARELNDEFLARMCEVLKGWDLLDDGQPLPINVATLRRIPQALLNDVFTTVIERLQSMRPKDRKRKLSGAT